MNNKSKFSLTLLIALLITGLLSSCFKEDLSDCPVPIRVSVRALDVEQNDITATGQVKNVILFAFNENQDLVDVFQLSLDEVKRKKMIDIDMDYPGHEAITFIAWGNVDNSLDVSDISSVKKLIDLYVRLVVKDGYAQPASDFFRGNLSVFVERVGDPQTATRSTKEHVVDINRMTAGVTINTVSLKEYNDNKEGNYTYVLRSSSETYYPEGNQTGEAVAYAPNASFTSNGIFSAPIFYTFPTEYYTVEIYYDGRLIYTADKDADGNQFVPQVGRTLNILIDFRAGTSIKTVITPWNVVYQYVEL